ncbi:MAG: carboxypeptidase-like regulatory domain-containing protein, partial [Syntrophothermus sp.]
MKIYCKIILALLLLSSGMATTNAQNVTGTVYEQTSKGNNPLPGVNLYWMGTTRGTTTDADGKFSLPVHGRNKKMIASFIGYKSDTISLAGNLAG